MRGAGNGHPFSAPSVEVVCVTWSVEIVEQSTELAVTLEEAKAHLRVDHEVEDALIERLIRAAMEDAEAFQGRSLTTRTLRLHIDGFPTGRNPLYLPYPPLQRVEAVKYRTVTGNLVSLDPQDYVVDHSHAPARIVPMPGRSWPTVAARQAGSVQVTYIAGYSNELPPPSVHAWQPLGYTIAAPVAPRPIPEATRQAILLMVGHLYENREAVSAERGNAVELPMGVKHLLMKHRVFMPEVR